MNDYNRQIKEMAREIMESFILNLVSDFEENNIISPIEKLFYAAWQFKTMYEDGKFRLIPQQKIGKYKVDFTVDCFEYFLTTSQRNLDDSTAKRLGEISDELPNVVIELDGHEWHEKTPKQVENDKIRERFLINNGFTVLRFSGREVVKNPKKCVNEVLGFIRPLQNKIYKKFCKLGGW